MLAEVHSIGSPRVEVVARRDRPTHPLLLPDTPVLIERAVVTRDAGGVHALRTIDIVRSAIAEDGAHESRSRRTPRAPAIDDVVLNERICRPAVERQIRIAVGIERT